MASVVFSFGVGVLTCLPWRSLFSIEFEEAVARVVLTFLIPIVRALPSADRLLRICVVLLVIALAALCAGIFLVKHRTQVQAELAFLLLKLTHNFRGRQLALRGLSSVCPEAAKKIIELKGVEGTVKYLLKNKDNPESIIEGCDWLALAAGHEQLVEEVVSAGGVEFCLDILENPDRFNNNEVTASASAVLGNVWHKGAGFHCSTDRMHGIVDNLLDFIGDGNSICADDLIVALETLEAAAEITADARNKERAVNYMVRLINKWADSSAADDYGRAEIAMLCCANLAGIAMYSDCSEAVEPVLHVAWMYIDRPNIRLETIYAIQNIIQSMESVEGSAASYRDDLVCLLAKVLEIEISTSSSLMESEAVHIALSVFVILSEQKFDMGEVLLSSSSLSTAFGTLLRQCPESEHVVMSVLLTIENLTVSDAGLRFVKDCNIVSDIVSILKSELSNTHMQIHALATVSAMMASATGTVRTELFEKLEEKCVVDTIVGMTTHLDEQVVASAMYALAEMSDWKPFITELSKKECFIPRCQEFLNHNMKSIKSSSFWIFTSCIDIISHDSEAERDVSKIAQDSLNGIDLIGFLLDVIENTNGSRVTQKLVARLLRRLCDSSRDLTSIVESPRIVKGIMELRHADVRTKEFVDDTLDILVTGSTEVRKFDLEDLSDKGIEVMFPMWLIGRYQYVPLGISFSEISEDNLCIALSGVGDLKKDLPDLDRICFMRNLVSFIDSASNSEDSSISSALLNRQAMLHKHLIALTECSNRGVSVYASVALSLLSRSPSEGGLSNISIEFLPKFHPDVLKLPADQKCCMTCWHDYTNEAEIRVLPCLHFFHADCVDQWLTKDPCCPMCRFSVLRGINAELYLEPIDGFEDPTSQRIDA